MLSALMLLLAALLVGWVPLLGPLLLGVLAGRAAPLPQALVFVLPALAVQGLALYGLRLLAAAVQESVVGAGLWPALSWLGGPLLVGLGRMVAGSDVPGFLLLFTLPVLPGLWLGARWRRAARW